MEHDSTHATDVGMGDLTPGAVLRSRYVLEEVIGRGGHSLVFRAKDLHRATREEPDGGRIALKALQPAFRGSTRAIERLSREFRQMQRLSHPGIARVFDLDCDGDLWFITMELVNAQTAAEWLQTTPAVGDAMQVIGRCADALQYAHAMGVIHGDLKPSNVLVTPDRQIKLIDFGSVPPQTDRVSSAAATPSYASPQILAGMRAEGRDDVFSLACVCYEIFSQGQRPFGDQSSLDAHRARLCPAAIPGMPVEAFSALVRSLAGDREQRAASPEELHRDLLGNAAVLTGAAGGNLRGGPRRTLRRASLASIGVAAACSLVLLPTARKIAAGDEELAVHTTSPQARLSSVGATQLVADRSKSEGWGDLSPLRSASAAAIASASTTPEPELAGDAVLSDSAIVEPRVGGFVTFENAALMASEAQSLIAIPVKRTESTHGAAAVEWQVEGGGSYVDAKSMQSQIVRFNDGETVRSIFIPLAHNTTMGGVHAARSFTVTLRRVGSGVRLGAVTRINVTIEPQPRLPDLSNTVAVSFNGR